MQSTLNVHPFIDKVVPLRLHGTSTINITNHLMIYLMTKIVPPPRSRDCLVPLMQPPQPDAYQTPQGPMFLACATWRVDFSKKNACERKNSEKITSLMISLSLSPCLNVGCLEYLSIWIFGYLSNLSNSTGEVNSRAC